MGEAYVASPIFCGQVRAGRRNFVRCDCRIAHKHWAGPGSPHRPGRCRSLHNSSIGDDLLYKKTYTPDTMDSLDRDLLQVDLDLEHIRLIPGTSGRQFHHSQIYGPSIMYRWNASLHSGRGGNV